MACYSLKGIYSDGKVEGWVVHKDDIVIGKITEVDHPSGKPDYRPHYRKDGSYHRLIGDRTVETIGSALDHIIATVAQ